MRRTTLFYGGTVALFILGLWCSLTMGKYPLSLSTLLSGDVTARLVFFNLRLARTVMAVLAGFGLSLSGYVYQTIFKNPIASPDIIGVSSGACAGAGVAIILLGSGTFVIALSAFLGGLVAVVIALALASVARDQKLSTFVLSGIAVSALAQAVLMLLKRVADPMDELAALEFWTMGSLSAVRGDKVLLVAPIIVLASVLLFLLHRQITLLSLHADEAQMLGVSVGKVRGVVLLASTLVVGAIVSVTGLITFVGLIAPHITRLVTKIHSRWNLFFSGLLGAGILLLADVLARSLASTEVPISILTSLLGAPLLLILILRGGRVE